MVEDAVAVEIAIRIEFVFLTRLRICATRVRRANRPLATVCRLAAFIRARSDVFTRLIFVACCDVVATRFVTASTDLVARLRAHAILTIAFDALGNIATCYGTGLATAATARAAVVTASQPYTSHDERSQRKHQLTVIHSYLQSVHHTIRPIQTSHSKTIPS